MGDGHNKRALSQTSSSRGRKKQATHSSGASSLETQLLPASTYNLAPYSLRMKAYEKFFHYFAHTINNHTTSSLAKLISDHYEEDFQHTVRYWCRSNLRAKPGLNPVGMYNYVELHGLQDYARHLQKTLSLIPDGCLHISDVEIKIDINSHTTIAVCRTKFVGTIVSGALSLPSSETALEPRPQLFPSSSSDVTQSSASADTALQTNDAEQQERLRETLYRADVFADVHGQFLHPLSRRMEDPPMPSIGESEAAQDAAEANTVDNSTVGFGAALRSMGVDTQLLQAARSIISLSQSTSTASCAPSQPDLSPRSSSTHSLSDGDRSLTALPGQIPVVIRGILIMRFRQYEVDQIFQGEHHYYVPAER